MRIERVGLGRLHGALGAGVAEGRPRGELAGQGAGLKHQLVVGQALPDQAPVGGLLRGQGLRGQRQPHGALRTQQFGQVPAARGVGDQADLAEGLDEFRGFRRQRQVAGQRQRGPRPGRHAIDRANHGHRQGLDLAHQRRPEAARRVAQIGRSVHLARIAVAQILPGAEAPTGAGQQHGARLGASPGQRGAQGHMLVFVEGIEPLGPVERDFQHTCFKAHQNGVRIAHIVLPARNSAPGGLFHQPSGQSINLQPFRDRIVAKCVAGSEDVVLYEYPRPVAHRTGIASRDPGRPWVYPRALSRGAQGVAMPPGKRAFDLCVAAMITPVVLPMILIIALVILIRDGRPVFYAGERMKTRPRASACGSFARCVPTRPIPGPRAATSPPGSRPWVAGCGDGGSMNCRSCGTSGAAMSLWWGRARRSGFMSSVSRIFMARC